jgi:hypothetical protein
MGHNNIHKNRYRYLNKAFWGFNGEINKNAGPMVQGELPVGISRIKIFIKLK